MKLVFTFAAFVFSVNTFASQSVVVIRPGLYESRHDVAIMYADNEPSCNENGGVWEQDVCLIKDAADSIEIKVVKYPVKKVLVSIQAVGTNLHTCEFEGESKALPSGRLLVSADVELYGEDGQPKHQTCKLLIDKKQSGLSSTVVQGAEEACSTFCGVSMSLDIEGARKVNLGEIKK
jgi:hypothetical protein